MPTTMTIAGIAIGSRQRNSTTRRIRGTRTMVQTIVGTRRISIPRTVRRAISSEVRMESMRSGLSKIAAYESSVRVPKSPRVENSSIANSGRIR
jgi:hypothetical protein